MPTMFTGAEPAGGVGAVLVRRAASDAGAGAGAGAGGCGRGAGGVVVPPDGGGGAGAPPRPTGWGFTPGGGGGGVCGRLWASAGVAASSATQTDSSITRVMR